MGWEVGTTGTNLGQLAICSCTLEQEAMWDLIFTRATWTRTDLQLHTNNSSAEPVSLARAVSFSMYLLAAAPAGSFVWGQLLLHTGGALHFLGVKGNTTERTERRGHLETWLQTLPTEPGTADSRGGIATSVRDFPDPTQRIQLNPNDKIGIIHSLW